jgi:hypothetical protein
MVPITMIFGFSQILVAAALWLPLFWIVDKRFIFSLDGNPPEPNKKQGFHQMQDSEFF